MPKKLTIIGEAQPEEQGSFCGRESEITYTNGPIVEAVRQEHNAIERDEEVLWMDASVDQSIPYQVPEDQRFNISRTEQDSQGVARPPKFGPGH